MNYQRDTQRLVLAIALYNTIAGNYFVFWLIMTLEYC
ncbi:hypothetical protein PTE_01799 [Photorhabdus khanii NC19]|uniref:Uncharacterized protein n=1 Tax=Photorhabdus khanii NC19 TaxID=1004151 RepID=W3V7Z4_9GAMM|nr:hypothetical protein PTE_01799 [Photorhabdus khanii NC19]